MLRFEAFTLDVPGGALLRGGERVVLRRQPFKVLAYLAERSGQLVTNNELIEACWENPRQTRINSLTQCIKAIREALGETEHEIIRTVHGQGYVFAAPVTAVSPSPPAPATPPEADAVSPLEERVADGAQPQTQAERDGATSAPASGEIAPARPSAGRAQRVFGRLSRLHGALGLPATMAVAAAVLLCVAWAIWTQAMPQPQTMAAEPSIAVLPIKVVGDMPEAAPLPGSAGDIGDALTDDLETELSRTPRGYPMRIRSASGYRGPFEPPQNAGRMLGVRYLVVGSTRREGDARHVNIQLVEAESGRSEWAQPFRYVTGEPGAQGRLATQIARLLHAQVLRAESRLPLPEHPAAGNYVILGRALMSAERGIEANRQAMAHFAKALTLDPNSVTALQGYARTRINEVLNRWSPKEQWEGLLHEADEALKRAASIEPAQPGLQVARGAYLRARGKDAEAIAAFQRAIDMHPNYPLAHAELGRAKIEVGLASETVAHIEEAIRLSPSEPYIAGWYYWAGMAEAHMEHYAAAAEWLLKARQANRSYPNTLPWLAVAYAGIDKWDEARAYVDEYRKAWPKFALASWRLALPQRNPAVAAQRQRIEALLRRLGVPETAPGSQAEIGLVR